MITPTVSTPRRLRPKLWMALLAATLSLLGGAQALAPTTAAAMDDLNATSECTEGTDWSYLDDVGAECSDGGGGAPSDAGVPSGGEPPSDGRNEIIEVSGTAPDTGSGVHPVGGPRPNQSGSGRDGESKAGPRGGSGSRSGPAKPERPPFKWPRVDTKRELNRLRTQFEECRSIYLLVQKFYDDERKISRGEMGFWRWLRSGAAPSTEQFERYLGVWKKEHCDDLYPTTVY